MLRNFLLVWLMTLPFLPIATAIFTPFVRRVTSKQLKACIFYSALIQLIALACYCLVFLTIPRIFFPKQSFTSISLGYVYFVIFIASLIIGPTFSTMVARFLLSIKNTKDLKHIFIGNLWVFGAMWLILRLLPF